MTFCTIIHQAYDPTTKLYDFHARMYDPLVGRFLSEDPIKGLSSLTQTMSPYTYVVNDSLAHPDPGGMLIANFDDPLVSSGGDSPHNARANKQPCDTDSEEDDCPGVNDLKYRWGVFQLYMDHCVTKHVVQFLSFGGGGVGLVSDLDKYVMKISEFAQKAGAVVRLVTWADALSLYTADALGGGNGVILTAVTAPTLLIVTPQRK